MLAEHHVLHRFRESLVGDEDTELHVPVLRTVGGVRTGEQEHRVVDDYELRMTDHLLA